MAEKYEPQGTPESPWFAQVKPGTGSAGLSITQDRGLTNQQVGGVAADLSGQNEDVVAALDAIAAAFTAMDMGGSGGDSSQLANTVLAGPTSGAAAVPSFRALVAADLPAISFSSALAVGSTAITSGTTTSILYDNAGILGEYTISGSGTVVAMATSPSLTTPVINTAAHVGGAWVADAAWTLPAFTLGGTVTSNGQSFSGTIANLGTVTTADIDGGTIDGTIVGGASAAAGTFTTLNGNTSVQTGVASTTTGSLILAHASSAFLTTITAGNAAAARTYVWPTNFGAAGTVLTDAAGNGTLSWAAASLVTLTVGSTTIASGTTTRILYDNAGVLGEYTISGSGTAVAMATSPSLTTSALLSSGFVFNWDSSDVTLTHSSNALTLAGGQLLLPDGSLSLPALGFGSDPDTGVYWVSSNTIGIVEGGVNISRSVPITNISDPSTGVGAGAGNRMLATLDENWFQYANFHWLISTNDQIYPAHLTVTGTWLAGDTAQIAFTITTIGTRTYTHTVIGGGTSTAAVAAALHALMAADTVLTNADIFIQAVGGSGWDIPIHYSQSPMTFSPAGTVSAGGTFSYSDTSNILDGPVGLYFGRRATGRTAQAEDFIAGLDWWGQYDSSANLRTYAREGVFIDIVNELGRFQWHTLDHAVEDCLVRMVLRKGLYLTTSAGASPSGGTNGDMGSGTINTPDQTGYYVNGIGYLRANSTTMQLINNEAAGVVQIGANGTAIVNVDSNNLYPESNGGSDLGKAATREWRNLFLHEGSIIDWDNGDVTITQTGNVLAFAGASSGYTFDAQVSCTDLTSTGNTVTGNASGDTFIDNCKSHTRPNMPAFFAYNSSQDANVTGSGEDVTIDFDTEVYDRGADFSADTFTAPITGIYILIGAVTIQGVTDHTTMILSIVVAGTSAETYQVFNGNPTALKISGIVSVPFALTLPMTATDTAVVKMLVSGGAGGTVVDIYGGTGPKGTYFAGHMVG